VNYGFACHKRPNDSLTAYTSYIHTWSVYTLVCALDLYLTLSCSGPIGSIICFRSQKNEDLQMDLRAPTLIMHAHGMFQPDVLFEVVICEPQSLELYLVLDTGLSSH
jgi:hypothetical protein